MDELKKEDDNVQAWCTLPIPLRESTLTKIFLHAMQDVDKYPALRKNLLSYAYMSVYPGTFIMFDGIAGSGKSTLLQALKESFITSGKRVFDIQDWNAQHQSPPHINDILEYDVYMLAEPTKTWIGSAIRQEIAFHPEYYSARTQAEVFALDRMMQYRRVVIPALRLGKTIIQDRGVTTSLVYQSTLDPQLSMQDIAYLAGNRIALEYAPTHLVLTQIDPSIALARRNNRTDTSKGMYEETELLRRAQETFHNQAFYDFMKAHGTSIHTVNTNGDIDSTTTQFLSLIKSFITL